MLRRFRVVLIVLALAVVGTLTATSSSAVMATAPDSSPASPPDPAATSLAADRHISLAEAQERLRWQQHASDLKTRLRATLGTTRYGDLWIDPDDGDRLKVGIVGATSTDRATVANAATAESVAGVVDVVGVRYSEAQLASATDWISERLVSVNKKAPWPLQLGHTDGNNKDGNRLQLELPRKGKLTRAQRALLSQAESRYGDMLQTGSYDHRVVGLACSFPYCDPPLRAGIRTHSPTDANMYCTGGFLGRSQSDNKLYMFTAGHCPWAGGASTWWTKFTDGKKHDLGPAWNGIWSDVGDMGILQITNEAGWKPRAWTIVYSSSDTNYNAEYSITDDKYSTRYQRICLTGASSYSDCGTVTDLGQTETYGVYSTQGVWRQETVKGLGKVADECGAQGDSGGPQYANHFAFGITVAGRGSAITGDCVVFYQGIKEAEDLMHVNVAHDA